MSEFVHTGLYGDEAEIVLCIALIAGSRNTGFDSKALMKKLRTDYVDLYEVRKLQINGGRTSTSDIISGRCYSMTSGAPFVGDIYQDEFGEVIIKVESAKAPFDGRDVSIHEFFDLFKMANNLTQIVKIILPTLIEGSSVEFELDSSLLMVCDDGDDADYSLSSIEIPYKKPLKAQISRETFNEIYDYIRYVEHYYKTGASYKIDPNMKWLYEPIRNPLEIEARRVTLAEERKILEQFADDCGNRIAQLRAGIGELKKQASAAIVEDFGRYSGVVEKFRR